jgi:hypothetical protein
MDINVVKTQEAAPEDKAAIDQEPEDETESENELIEAQQPTVPADPERKERAERTDDLVRLYFRNMSSVELLSREGEIAIRGWPQGHDRRTLRESTHLRPSWSAGTTSTKAKSSCATLSTSKQLAPLSTP